MTEMVSTEPEPFVKDAWYVAASSAELDAGPVARRILDVPVFLYRAEKGKAVAMLDRCPHRRFPLSKSNLEGSDVRCGYHGIKFGSDGRCLEVPTQKNAGSNLRVRTFEVSEFGDWIWIWTGNGPSSGMLPPQAPEFTEDAGWRRRQILAQRVASRASLFHDNLLDLSHLSYLHASNIGGSGVAMTAPTLKQTDFGLSVRREVLDNEMHGLPLGRAMGIQDTVVRIIAQQFYKPSFHATGSAFFEPDADGKPDTPIGSFRILHALTPETATSVHYFQAYQRNFRVDDPECDRMLEFVLNLPIPEDIFATEIIEAELSRVASMEAEKHIPSDAVGLRGRLIVERMVKSEQDSRSLDVAAE